VFFDDIWIGSQDEQEHLAHLKSVLLQLNNNKVKVNLKRKYTFVKHVPSFLMFTVPPEDIFP
jgi:hypothetical protein